MNKEKQYAGTFRLKSGKRGVMIFYAESGVLAYDHAFTLSRDPRLECVGIISVGRVSGNGVPNEECGVMVEVR